MVRRSKVSNKRQLSQGGNPQINRDKQRTERRDEAIKLGNQAAIESKRNEEITGRKPTLIQAAPEKAQQVQPTQGSVTLGEVQTQKKRQEQIAGFVPEISKQEIEDAEEGAGRESALTQASNVAAAGAGFLGGATVGAAIGGPLAPITAPAFGVIGAVAGVSGKIAADRRQIVKNQKTKFTNTVVARDQDILNLANSGVEPSQVLAEYEKNLANLYAVESVLKKQTRGAFGEQLSGGMDELIAVQAYISHEQERRAWLILAMQNPDPSRIVVPQEETQVTDQPFF